MNQDVTAVADRPRGGRRRLAGDTHPYNVLLTERQFQGLLTLARSEMIDISIVVRRAVDRELALFLGAGGTKMLDSDEFSVPDSDEEPAA